MTEMERRYYALEAKQLTEPCSERINWLQIILRHLKRMRSSREINDPVVNDEVTIIAARRRFLCFPNIKILSYYSTKQRRKVESYRSKCRKKIGESLSRMGVPEDEHPNICEEVFKVLDVVVCPELPVRVDFVDVTERILLGTADDVHDMVSRESMETYRPNFIPATKSSIEGLEKVRIEDGLELEAITGQMPSCVICMKSLEPRRRRRQGGGIKKKKKKKKKKKRPTMITLTRLPCFHHFHGDCIVKWLDISHLCPMCRYPMPTAEVGQPSNP